MTKIQYKYKGTLEKAELMLLESYLIGKKDAEAWRNDFEKRHTDYIPFNGRIYAAWAIRDLHMLIKDRPGIEKTLLPKGKTLKDFPTLEHVLELG